MHVRSPVWHLSTIMFIYFKFLCKKSDDEMRSFTRFDLLRNFVVVPNTNIKKTRLADLTTFSSDIIATCINHRKWVRISV